MTKIEILEYIQFRASGFGQAPNYTYKDFYDEIVEMQRKEVKKLTIPVVSESSGNCCKQCKEPIDDGFRFCSGLCKEYYSR